MDPRRITPLVLLFSLPGFAWAGGHPKQPDPAPLDGKRVILVDPIFKVEIQMPDESRYPIGPDLEATLTRQLIESGRYVIAQDDPPASGVAAISQPSLFSSFTWHASSEPAARLKIRVTEFSFESGSRGNRLFYGFNERIPNMLNEFPLRTTTLEPTWFDRTFDPKGQAPLDSLSGLDLGDGFQLNAIIAGIKARYAEYHAHLSLNLEIEQASGERDFRQISVAGDGFYVDLAGAYYGYAGGIKLARTDAMTQALGKAIEGSFQAVDRAVRALPMAARVDAVVASGEILLGTGRDARVAVGTRYRSLTRPAEVVVEVVSSQTEGSIAKVVQGFQVPEAGERLIQSIPGVASVTLAATAAEGENPAIPSISDQIVLPWTNIPKSKGARRADAAI